MSLLLPERWLGVSLLLPERWLLCVGSAWAYSCDRTSSALNCTDCSRSNSRQAAVDASAACSYRSLTNRAPDLRQSEAHTFDRLRLSAASAILLATRCGQSCSAACNAARSTVLVVSQLSDLLIAVDDLFEGLRIVFEELFVVCISSLPQMMS